MTEAAKTVLERFPVRKSKAQKAEFRSWLQEQLEGCGWTVREESGGTLVRSVNVAAGDLDNARVIFTAHYDTCAALPFPNFIAPQSLIANLGYLLALMLLFCLLAIAVEVAVLLATGSVFLGMAAVYAVLILCVWAMLCGKANKHNTNDNTSGVMLLLELAAHLPPEQRGAVCLVFFDNEEKGMLGSGQFRKAHRAQTDKPLLVNFDCVSDGDTLCFFPGKALRKEGAVLDALERAFQPTAQKAVSVQRGFALYPSDQTRFPRAVGVAAMHTARFIGFYLSRIHTKRDTVLQEENLQLLLDGSLRLTAALAGPAVEKEGAR